MAKAGYPDTVNTYSQDQESDVQLDAKPVALEVEEKEIKEERNVKIFKICKTVALVCAWISMGVCASIIGPTQLDLQERLGCDTTTEDMSQALIGRNMGIIFGSFFVAVVNDRFRQKSDIIMSVCLFTYGFAVLLKPWANELWLLALLYFIEGCAHGSQNVVGNAMIMMTWGQEADTPMHALHFGYGVGATFGPLVARPFLSSGGLCDTEYDNSTNNSTAIMTTTFEDYQESSIEIAYAITSTLPLTLGFVFLAFYLIKPPRQFVLHGGVVTSVKETFSPGRCSDGATGFVFVMITLISIFWFLYGGRYNMIGYYLFTYAVESDLAFSKDEAATINSAYGAAQMVGRGIAIPISHYVPMQIMFLSEVYLCGILITCLTFVGITDQLYFWIFICLYSAVDATIYPTGVAWYDKYAMLVSIIVAILNIAAHSGGIICQLMAGYIFTYKDPDDMIYLAFGIGMVMCAYVIVMQLIASRHGTRFKEKEDDIVNVVQPEELKSTDTVTEIEQDNDDVTSTSPGGENANKVEITRL